MMQRNTNEVPRFSMERMKLGAAWMPSKVVETLQEFIDSPSRSHDYAATNDDISTLLSVMTKHVLNASVQVKALEVLALLTNKRTAKLISLEGGAKVVIETMENHPDLVSIQELGCSVIVELVTVDNKSVEIEGGFKVLLSAIERFPDHVAIHTSARGALSLLTNSENQADRAVSLGVTEPVLKLMEAYPNHTKVQSLCSELLSHLAFPRAGALEVEKRGGIDLMIGAMKQYPDHASIQQNLCQVLCQLLVNNWDSSMSIVDKGGITCIIGALRHHADREMIQEFGYKALLLLSYKPSDPCSPHKIFCEMIVKDLVVTSILNTMKKHHGFPGVQYACLRLLSYLMLSDSDVVHRLAEAGGIQVTVSALQSHRKDPNIQDTGLSALIKFSRYGSYRDRIARDGGIDCVLDSMRHHECDADVQYRGCFLLKQFSGDAIIGFLSVTAGGIECVSTAMEKHQSNAYVQDQGGKYLKLVHDSGASTLSVVAAAA